MTREFGDPVWLPPNLLLSLMLPPFQKQLVELPSKIWGKIGLNK
jgi:hypothetical protein